MKKSSLWRSPEKSFRWPAIRSIFSTSENPKLAANADTDTPAGVGSVLATRSRNSSIVVFPSGAASGKRR